MRTQRGFSLLELAIVAVIISILFVIAANKLLGTRSDAEITAMESAVGTLRSALNIRVAAYLAKDDVAAIAALENSNPMANLSELPKNYLGELAAPKFSELETGTWYFDTRDRALVYLVKNTDYFRGGLAAPPRARFAVRLVYQDSNGNKVFDKGRETLNGVRLVELEPYSWLKQPSTASVTPALSVQP